MDMKSHLLGFNHGRFWVQQESWVKLRVLDEAEKISGVDTDVYHGTDIGIKELIDIVERQACECR